MGKLLPNSKVNDEELSEGNYSDEFKAELDSRYEDYLNGENLVSEEEANKRIRRITENTEQS